ncbi:PEGA domain-containing protein [Thermococcus barophilus]|uniref:VWFA domain-containing protein n=1 Tax=Thermococcus barophilus (strain DSM 11836 / MP) TaxID=391623 RepID=F0LM01_THEBM|nr:PEGA domain-containing protein [Thermococcus barophilus]ADT85100.1 hypothetical protein TERMP_02126 [Thermococcus barophilus MP]
MKKELQCLLIISLLLMSLGTVPAFQGNYVEAGSENVFITVDSSNFPSEVVLRISLNVSETLSAENFEVYENGVRQQITGVYYTGEGLIMPIDVVFIIDRSDSMDSYIEAIKNSAYQFSYDLERIGGENVRFALVTFANYDDARIDLPLTNNVSEFVEALNSIYTAGGTEWSFGGILKALDLEFNPNAQKVFIVVTDEDDQSPYSVEEVANNLTAEGVLLALVYNHRDGQKLSALSEMIGALDIDISEVQQNGFEEVLHYITTTIGQQYQIVYTPTNQSMDGGERLVKVIINLPDGTYMEANVSYIAKERSIKRYEKVMLTDQEILNILGDIAQWFDESNRYLSMMVDNYQNINLASASYYSMIHREYIPPLPLEEPREFNEFLSKINDLPDSPANTREVENLLMYFTLALNEEGDSLTLKNGTTNVTITLWRVIGFPLVPVVSSEYPIGTPQIRTGEIYKISIQDVLRNSTFYISHSVSKGSPRFQQVEIQDLKIPVEPIEISTLYERVTIYQPMEVDNNAYLVPKIEMEKIIGGVRGKNGAILAAPMSSTVKTLTDYIVEQEYGYKTFKSTSVDPFSSLYIYAGVSGIIEAKVKFLFWRLLGIGGGLDVQFRYYPVRDRMTIRLGSRVGIESIAGEIWLIRGVETASISNASEIGDMVKLWFLYTFTDIPLLDQLAYGELQKTILDAEYSKRSEFLNSTYLFAVVEKSLNFGKLPGQSFVTMSQWDRWSRSPHSKLTVTQVSSIKNNLYRRSFQNYVYKFEEGIKISYPIITVKAEVPLVMAYEIPSVVSAGIFGTVKASAGVSTMLYGYQIVDPVASTSVGTYIMNVSLISESPVDTNSDGLFDGLRLTIEIHSNATGEYNGLFYLLANNTVIVAWPADLSITNSFTLLEILIPSQYLYYTNYTGPFDVGLIIEDENGSIVYSNFSLGRTNSYDYRQFEHVTPQFDFRYVPVDSDKDGKYDEIQVNITELNNLTGITISPILMAPSWMVYLNSTNLTSTSVYTTYIDGMHVRKFMGNFSFMIHVTNKTSGIYLGSYNWSINVDPMKFESAYPTIVDVIPRTINYKPAVTFTVNVSRDSNISIILKYSVGGLVYDTWGYFENVTPGIQNFTVFLDPSAFVLNNTRKATLLSATLITNDLTTDSVKINKEVSFFLLSRADILNIDQNLNAVKKLLNMTIDLISYEDVNSTVVVVLSSGNVTLTNLAYPEMHEKTILELPVTFNLSGILSNVSENGTLSVIMYDENGELLKMKTVNVDLSPLFTPGHLRVYSNPSGASVYINNVYFGTTPLEVDLLPGEYTLELSKEGYQKLIISVTINSGESKTIYATLSPGFLPATLEISSFPSGAKVYIDDELKGLTPLTVEVSPGTHTVKLIRDGYHEYVTTLTIDQGETITINVRLTPLVNYAPFSIGDYTTVVNNASSVFFVFNNYGTPDAFSVSQYVSRTLPIDKRAVSRLAREFDFNEVASNDLIISVGGPLVNNVTARYDNASAVHMSISGGSITIVTPQENITWIVPRPWWNVTEGYFIIQAFYDREFNTTVFTIYGTDADSTAAGAYYFLTEVYPNIAAYNSISYIVGKWEDTEAGADIPLPGANLGDTSGFSAGDTITVIFIG